MRIIGDGDGRALLRITSNDADAEAILDRDAVAVGSLAEGYEVTAPWFIDAIGPEYERDLGYPPRWRSGPEGRLVLGEGGIDVNTNVMIEASLAAPNRTVRLADLPQLDSSTRQPHAPH